MKTKPATSIILVVAIAICVLRSMAARADVKPVIVQETLRAVPSTFDRLWTGAVVIAKVRITAAHASLVAGSPSRIETWLDGTVLQVLKGDATVGAMIRFSQVAGTLELPDKIIKVTDAEPLSSGEYVVFLARDPVRGTYFLFGDVDGAYKVDRGFLNPQGRFTDYAQSHRGMSERRFMEEIEGVAARHRAEK